MLVAGTNSKSAGESLGDEPAAGAFNGVGQRHVWRLVPFVKADPVGTARSSILAGVSDLNFILAVESSIRIPPQFILLAVRFAKIAGARGLSVVANLLTSQTGDPRWQIQ